MRSVGTELRALLEERARVVAIAIRAREDVLFAVRRPSRAVLHLHDAIHRFVHRFHVRGREALEDPVDADGVRPGMPARAAIGGASSPAPAVGNPAHATPSPRPLPDVGLEHRAVDPAAESHRLAEQHEVLEIEERLVVGAHARAPTRAAPGCPCSRSRCGPGRAHRSGDRESSDVIPTASADLREPLTYALRVELPPIVDEQRTHPIRLRGEDQDRVDVLPCAVHEGKNRVVPGAFDAWLFQPR